jgi:demethylmenaquinone methyltransferase/2-methoxy-6-polyprenyl-1,4-benzoquinol methylase
VGESSIGSVKDMCDFPVKKMFESIAYTYDFQNSFLSLGQDIFWRRVLAESIQNRGEGLILDAATGTAEVAIEICKRNPKSRVVGVDFSPHMLAVGHRKVKARGLGDRIRLAVGDGRRLPFQGSTFDAVTIAFGLRNIEKRGEALAEFRRMLKEGGELLIMEFDFPRDPVMGKLYGLYFDYVLGPLGNWVSRTKDAYTYLVESVRAFPRQEAFLEELAAVGFSGLRVKDLTYGIAKIYRGIKEGHDR